MLKMQCDIFQVLYLALVLYAPALAIHQVTGVNTMLIVSIMYLVCIFYTTMGGMKAVVWTDTFQVVVLYTALFVILIKGTIDVGGLQVVWQTNSMYNRTDLFNWDLNPTTRYTTWSAFIGSAFLHISFYGGNQLQIQRYLTVKTPQQARKMLWINTVGWTIVVLLTVYAGLLIFAHYITCDPFKSNRVKTADELFPLYVMETFHNLPGFPGLFLAGVFSAGLSTVSAGVNSLAALWIDGMRGSLMSNETWDKRSGIIAKILSFAFGVLSFLLVFLVPYLGGLAPVAISLSGIFTGSLFGIFCLGMFSRSANNAVSMAPGGGAMSGLLGSIAILMWIATGSVIFSPPSTGLYSELNIPTTGCFNSSLSPISKPNYLTYSSNQEEFSVYQISFLWYPMLACVLTVVIGMVVSAISVRFNCSNSHSPVRTQRANSEKNGTQMKNLKSKDENDVQTTEPFLRREKIFE
ncbi:hypothetical protein V9T40_014540 [Parthenolecanium corni]|uniref:Sodium-coupled monocarboxylate transporter 1 n=1 Tax=Parthenolecanium corni TaxID=536013 RepID=A0AAN9XXG1_9HEMI